MSDQEDFDQQLTTSQEYGIAFIVILLFGAMYLFFMKGCQPDSSLGQLFSPTQAVVANEDSNSQESVSAYQKATAQADAVGAEGGAKQDKTSTSANASSSINNDSSSVAQSAEGLNSDSTGSAQSTAESDSNQEASKVNAETRALAEAEEAARIKAEAAKLAAATAAQKLADQERFEAKQAELRAGKAELVIPKKPLTTASTSPQAETRAAGTGGSTQTKAETTSPAGSTSLASQAGQGKPAEAGQISQNSSAQAAGSQPATSKTAQTPFNLNEELARVDFKLPDGRGIQIPADGFENSLKQAILQNQSGQAIVFDRVSFFSGSDLLNPESSNQILSVAGILNTYKNVNIKLRGHTDSTGPDEENLTLSFKRSLNLKKQLVGLGIDTNRIQVEGLGASEPISDNGSERGRNKNRRIDLIIINKIL